MNTDVEIELTDDEQEAAGRVGVIAALDALGEYSFGLSQCYCARRVVTCLAAAHDALEREASRLAELKRGTVHVITTAAEAASTAYYLWVHELDDGDIPPRSLLGGRLVAFAQGMAAASLVSMAQDFLDWDESLDSTGQTALRLNQRTDSTSSTNST